MNRKILILLVSLCTTQADIRPINRIQVLRAGEIASIVVTIAGATIWPSILFIAASKYDKITKSIKDLLQELLLIQKITELRALSPQEQTLQNSILKSINKLLKLTPKETWKKQVQGLLKHYHLHTTTIKERKTKTTSSPSFFAYFMLSLAQLTPIRHRNILKTLYDLKQIATTRKLTKKETLQQKKALRMLQKKLSVTLHVTPSTDLKTIENIAKSYINKSNPSLTVVSALCPGLSLLSLALSVELGRYRRRLQYAT